MALDIKILTEATNKLTGNANSTQSQEGKLGGYKIAAIVCGSVAAVAAIATVVATVVFAAPLIAAGCTLAALGLTVAAIILGTRNDNTSLEKAASDLKDAAEATHEEKEKLKAENKKLKKFIEATPYQKLFNENSNLENLNSTIKSLEAQKTLLQASNDVNSEENQKSIQENEQLIADWKIAVTKQETKIATEKQKLEDQKTASDELAKAKKAVEELRQTNLRLNEQKSTWEETANNRQVALDQSLEVNRAFSETLSKMIHFFERKVKGCAELIESKNNKPYVSLENFETIVTTAREKTKTDKITISPPEEATSSATADSTQTEPSETQQ